MEADWSAILAEQEGLRLGRPLRIHAELDSAMDMARLLAEAGEPGGACVLTEHQRRGRGRQEREWRDTPGASLLLALILRPSWPPARGGLLALAAGLALAEAVEPLGVRLQLKWPNDCLHGERKVAGVLTEARLSAGAYRHLILGLGVNVHQVAADFPPELRESAGALDRIAGRRLSRAALLAAFLKALEPRLDALAADDPAPRRRLLADWQGYWPHANRLARDESGRRLRLVGPAEDGALHAEGPTGPLLIRAGELNIVLED
jgi:BirA family transcriptional regulator, biotin operon repressor / biotin---[acetyl-CoA-carboxylase] ligase